MEAPSTDSPIDLEPTIYDVVVDACASCNVGKGGQSNKYQRVLVLHNDDPLTTLVRKFYPTMQRTCRASLVSPQALPCFPRSHFVTDLAYKEYLDLRLASSISAEYLHCHNQHYCIVKGGCKSRFPRATNTKDQCESLAQQRGVLRMPRDHEYVVPHNPTATLIFPCNQSVEIDLCGELAMKHAFYKASYHSKSTFGHEQFRDWAKQFATILQASEQHIQEISQTKEQERKRTTNTVLVDLLRHASFGTPMLASWLELKRPCTWRHDFLTSFPTKKVCAVPFTSISTSSTYGMVSHGDNGELTTRAGPYFAWDHRSDALEYMSPYTFFMYGHHVKISSSINAMVSSRLRTRVQEVFGNDNVSPSTNERMIGWTTILDALDINSASTTIPRLTSIAPKQLLLWYDSLTTTHDPSRVNGVINLDVSTTTPLVDVSMNCTMGSRGTSTTNVRKRRTIPEYFRRSVDRSSSLGASRVNRASQSDLSREDTVASSDTKHDPRGSKRLRPRDSIIDSSESLDLDWVDDDATIVDGVSNQPNQGSMLDESVGQTMVGVGVNSKVSIDQTNSSSTYEDPIHGLVHQYTRTQDIDSDTGVLSMQDTRPDDMWQTDEEADDFGIQEDVDGNDDGVDLSHAKEPQGDINNNVSEVVCSPTTNHIAPLSTHTQVTLNEPTIGPIDVTRRESNGLLDIARQNSLDPRGFIDDQASEFDGTNHVCSIDEDDARRSDDDVEEEMHDSDYDDGNIVRQLHLVDARASVSNQRNPRGIDRVVRRLERDINDGAPEPAREHASPTLLATAHDDLPNDTITNDVMVSKSMMDWVIDFVRADVLEHYGAHYYKDAYVCAGTHWYRSNNKDVTVALFPYGAYLPTMPTMFKSVLEAIDGMKYLMALGDNTSDSTCASLADLARPLHPTIDRRYRRAYQILLRDVSPNNVSNVFVALPTTSDAWGDTSKWSLLIDHDWVMPRSHLLTFVASTWPGLRDDIQARIRMVVEGVEFCKEDGVAMEQYSSKLLGIFGSYRSTTCGKPADRCDLTGRLDETSLTQKLCERICVAQRSAQLVYIGEKVRFKVFSRVEPGAYVAIRSHDRHKEWLASVDTLVDPTPSNDRVCQMDVGTMSNGGGSTTCAICGRDATSMLVYGVCPECPRLAIVVSASLIGGCEVEYLDATRDACIETDEGPILRVYRSRELPSRSDRVATCRLLRTCNDTLDWRDVQGMRTSANFAHASLDAQSIRHANRKGATLSDLVACGVHANGCEEALQHDDLSCGGNTTYALATVLTSPTSEGWFEVHMPISLNDTQQGSCVTSLNLDVRIEKTYFRPKAIDYDGARVTMRAGTRSSTMHMWLHASRDAHERCNLAREVFKHRVFARDFIRWITNVQTIRTGMDAAELDYAKEVSHDQAEGDDIPPCVAQHKDKLTTIENTQMERTLVSELNRVMDARQVSTRSTSGCSKDEVTLYGALHDAGVDTRLQSRFDTTKASPLDASFVSRVDAPLEKIATALHRVAGFESEPEPEPESVHESVSSSLSSPSSSDPMRLGVDEEPSSTTLDAYAFDIRHILDSVDGESHSRPFQGEARECIRDCLCAVMKCDTCGMLCDVSRKASLPPRTIGSHLICKLCVDDDLSTCRRCGWRDVRSNSTILLCHSCTSTNADRPPHMRFGPKTPTGSRHPYNGMLVGSPGVGKTYVLKAIQRAHSLNGMDHQIFTCAKLSIAASNANGVTLDSLLPSFRKNASNSIGASSLQRLQATFGTKRFGILDEVYAIKIPELLSLDTSLQSLNGEVAIGGRLLFGGMHFLCTGDPFQLPPVKASNDAVYRFNCDFAKMSTSQLDAQLERRATEAKSATVGISQWTKTKRSNFAFWVQWQALENVHVLHKQHRIENKELLHIVEDCRSGFRDYKTTIARDSRIKRAVSWLNQTCWTKHPRNALSRSRKWLTCPALVPWNVHVDILRWQRLLYYAARTNVQVFGHRAIDVYAHGKQPLQGWCKSKVDQQHTKKCDNCPSAFLFARGYKYLMSVTKAKQMRAALKPLQRNYPKIGYCNYKQGTAREIGIDQLAELAKCKQMNEVDR